MIEELFIPVIDGARRTVDRFDQLYHKGVYSDITVIIKSKSVVEHDVSFKLIVVGVFEFLTSCGF